MKKDIKHIDIDYLLAAYLGDELTTAERESLQEWIEATPANKKYFQDMQAIWIGGLRTDQEERFNKNDAYKHFLLRTADKQKETSHSGKKNILSPVFYRVAIVALLIIVSGVSYWRGKEQIKGQFAEIVIDAPLGSKINMHLPDGSLVWLNAGSRITYSQGFGVSERKLSLTGEGYFEIKPNKKLPFTVETGELHVNVLGTKFNFRNYPEDEEAMVSLLEGKVWINNFIKKENDLTLLANQKVFLNKKNGSIRLFKGNVSNTVEWKNGFLFFDEDILSDIVKELERYYNVKITFADESLKTLRFYGVFECREYKIEEVLNILATTNKLRYTIKDKEIRLYTQ